MSRRRSPLPPWTAYAKLLHSSGYPDARIAEGASDRTGRDVSRHAVLRLRRRLGLPANRRPAAANLAEYRQAASAAYAMSAGWPQLAQLDPVPTPREVDLLCHLLDAGPLTALQLQDAFQADVWHPLRRLLKRKLVVVYRRLRRPRSGRPGHVYGLAPGVVKPMCREIY